MGKGLCQDKFPSTTGRKSKKMEILFLFLSAGFRIFPKLCPVCASTQTIRFSSEKQFPKWGNILIHHLETFPSACPDHFTGFMSASYPSTAISLPASDRHFILQTSAVKHEPYLTPTCAALSFFPSFFHSAVEIKVFGALFQRIKAQLHLTNPESFHSQTSQLELTMSLSSLHTQKGKAGAWGG